MAQNFARLKIRRDAAWTKNNAWQALYDDAYCYAIPNRRPRVAGPRRDGGEETTLEIFDSTASEMVYQSAAQLARRYRRRPVRRWGGWG